MDATDRIDINMDGWTYVNNILDHNSEKSNW